MLYQFNCLMILNDILLPLGILGIKILIALNMKTVLMMLVNIICHFGFAMGVRMSLFFCLNPKSEDLG